MFFCLYIKSKSFQLRTSKICILIISGQVAC